MKQGLYGLFSLDGSPLDPVSVETMDLGEAPLQHTGCAIRLIDTQGDAATSHFRTPEQLTIFFGYLDEPKALAAALDVSPELSPAALAWAAVERFGPDAPHYILGEWFLLRWNVVSRTLTLVNSATCRDPQCFSTDGRRIAIAPEMRRLARLPWNSGQLDRAGVALLMSRAGLRHALADRTAWQGVTRLAVARTEQFSSAGRTTRQGTPPAPGLWEGGFEDAIAEIDTLGRRMVRQQLERYGGAAFLLSGGLDSTLLTTWGALEQGPGREILALCSVAPAGSGLPDEREFAAAAAAQLGVRLEFVTPAEQVSIYRPDPAMFRAVEMPAVGPRHSIYEALSDAAAAHGVRAVIDGAYGEMTVTDKTHPPLKPTEFLDALRTARAWMQYRWHRPSWPDDAFHARFSREFMAELPPEWAHLWRQPKRNRSEATRDGRIGIHPSVPKILQQDTSTTHFGQRHLMPFRDPRLLRAVAAMPASFLLHGGHTRAMARALLRDRVPDSVRLRHWGMSFSPDYELRLQRQAAAAKSRVPLFREAGLGSWLDLDWLEAQLTLFDRGAKTVVFDHFAVHLTALTAEFLLWAQQEAGPGTSVRRLPRSMLK